jgi:hypothetical protein
MSMPSLSVYLGMIYMSWVESFPLLSPVFFATKGWSLDPWSAPQKIFGTQAFLRPALLEFY